MELCDSSDVGRNKIISRVLQLVGEGPEVAYVSADALMRVSVRQEQRLVLRNQGVPRLVSSLNRHTLVARIVKVVAATLVSVIDSSPPHKAQVQPAVAALATALTSHSSNEEVILQVVILLRSLTTEVAAQEAFVNTPGALDFILSTLTRHRLNAEVVEHLLGTWRNLAFSTCRPGISNSGVFEAVISMLNIHATKVGVVTQVNEE